MKILITGASGQLGSAVDEKFSSEGAHDILALGHGDLSITSRDDTFTCVTQFQPDVIVNAAAMTNVDGCETNVDDAFAINALGVRHLAQSADLVNAHLVHISTDFVFDGESDRAYSEYDLTNPLSIYAKSKLGGDHEASAYSRSTVLRVAWVFGNTRGDYFSWVLNGVRDGSINSLIDDQVGTPTYSYDIADVISHCVTHRIYGLMNVANEGETTRLAMGQEVCDRIGVQHNLAGIDADSLGRPAPRPAYSALSTSLLSHTTGIVMRPWTDALDDHLARISTHV